MEGMGKDAWGPASYSRTGATEHYSPWDERTSNEWLSHFMDRCKAAEASSDELNRWVQEFLDLQKFCVRFGEEAIRSE